jgi:hypothetical protein
MKKSIQQKPKFLIKILVMPVIKSVIPEKKSFLFLIITNSKLSQKTKKILLKRRRFKLNFFLYCTSNLYKRLDHKL